MSIRQAKRRAQEMHGHYNIHSYREDGNARCRYWLITWREFMINKRVRVGFSHNSPWKNHV